MKKIKEWCLNHAVELIIIGCIIFFLLLPILWLWIYDKLNTFDLLKFTEEWYKTISTSLGVGVIVILLADRLKDNRTDRKVLMLIAKQKQNSKNIINAFELGDIGKIKDSIDTFLSCHSVLKNMTGNSHLNGIEKSTIVIDEMNYYVNNIDPNPNLCINAEQCIKEFCNSFLL